MGSKSKDNLIDKLFEFALSASQQLQDEIDECKKRGEDRPDLKALLQDGESAINLFMQENVISKMEEMFDAGASDDEAPKSDEIQYQPKSGMCLSCKHEFDDCSSLNFKEMPVIEKYKHEGADHCVVKCSNHKRYTGS